MSWKIKTDPETPFLFTPGASGAGGHMVPFDVEGLSTGNWWLSGLCDLGSSPRTSKFWWQGKVTLPANQAPGSFVSFYAVTMDDNDLSNIDGLPQESGTLPDVGNRFVPGSSANSGGGTDVRGTCNPPDQLQVTVTGWIHCTCFNGTFILNWDDNLNLWSSNPIIGCPGQTDIAYFRLRWNSNNYLFGLTDSGSLPGEGGSDGAWASGVSCYPLEILGGGATDGNIVSFCNGLEGEETEDKNMAWKVTANESTPPSFVTPNLHYIGSLASDGTNTFVSSGYVEVDSRYVYIAAFNGTPQALSPSGTDHQFMFLPVPDEVQ